MFKLFFVVCQLIFIVSCSQMPVKRRATPPSKEPTPSQEVVLLEEGHLEEPQEVIEEKEPPKLGIVLGPGSVKTFAHTGVIKELEKARIPISYIVGIEWGALVGGLYASNVKINDTEWKLYKLQEKKLNKSHWLLGGEDKQTISAYKEFFDKNIENLNISQLKIPFACPSVSVWSGTIIWQDKGLLSKAIERCMPSPPLFEPKSPWMAALFASEEAIRFLKDKGMDAVLYVDVLGKSQPLSAKELMSEFEAALIWQELKNDISRIIDTDDTLKVEANTMRFKLYDFSARSSLSAAGGKAGLRAADVLVEKYGF